MTIPLRPSPRLLPLLVPMLLLVALLPARPAVAVDVPQLVSVRAAHHPGFDRVVWQFDGPLPERRLVHKGTTLVGDGSGERIPIAGRVVLTVTMFSARAHDEDTGRPTAPARLAPGLPNVVEVKQAGDFEAVVTYGVGLVVDRPYRLSVLRSPSRVVLDVRTDVPTVQRRVFFQHRPRFVAGRAPYVEPVVRSVPTASPAAAVLHQLFAGPTAAERRRGLRLVASGATGFRDLSVRDGVARLRLVGGCDSRGSTFTIADQVLPTLKAVGGVRWVKIYDPAGRTARPSGRSDSVPGCLEP